ncbi:methyltransferase domain-containing protein [Salinarimonas ramus]|uniref:Methyltransferase n=1 Tax=Salinarimonas ramus TaxID=690164 RepID=A0A917QIM5_9HYPH|nr:methyltransferase domain-containing protein [Salinarimonas ramus]GGK53062.1 methyltransferase [Salinarimonas ramus]
MSSTVFDRRLARTRLARARALGHADFLAVRAAEDLEDRLGAVLRQFPVVVDLGTPTAHLARALSSRPGTERVLRLAPLPEPGAVVADEEALPLAAESANLVVSALALQGVNDLPGTLIQARRALAPDGLLLACLLGGATLHELRQSFAAAEAETTGGVSPRVAPFADVRDLGALMQRAGFALPVVDADPIVVRYADVFGLLRDLRAMGLTNALVERRKAPLRRDTLARLAEIYAERYADPDGRVRATFELVWLSGWAPHESQQKPLRPGSARMRLADALGTREIGAGDKAKP